MTQALATHLPLRNRRRGRRIITVKNFWRLLLVAVLLFAGLTLASNLGKSTPGQYGRLYGQQQPTVGKAEFHPAIVTEAPSPISEQERADPMLLTAAARSQYLGTDATTTAATGATGSAAAAPGAATTSSAAGVDDSSFGTSPANAPLRHGQKVSVVGDANGVTVVKQ